MANPSKSKGTSLETWTVRYLAWALQDTNGSSPLTWGTC